MKCPKCGTRTDAYCYEHQSTQLWNKDETTKEAI